jgi:hypothetical protein
MPLFETLSGLFREPQGSRAPSTVSGHQESSNIRTLQSSEELQFLSVINGRRQNECPGQPLRIQPQLNSGAQMQASQMRSLTLADTQRLGLGYDVTTFNWPSLHGLAHTQNRLHDYGGGVSGNVSNAGYTFSSLGQNIGFGRTPEEAAKMLYDDEKPSGGGHYKARPVRSFCTYAFSACRTSRGAPSPTRGLL